MDSTVQLVRNTLCCVKDLDLFADTFLYDPSVISMPEPLHETTPLQALIGVTQFYAFVSISIQGVKLVFPLGFYKLHSAQKNLTCFDAMKGKNKLVLARGIVRESPKEDVAKTKINMIIGACLLSIGVPFLAFWPFVSVNSYELDRGCPCSNSCIDINGNRIVGAAVFYLVFNFFVLIVGCLYSC